MQEAIAVSALEAGRAQRRLNQEHQMINAQLQEHWQPDFEMIPVLGDGNCFYRAIAQTGNFFFWFNCFARKKLK